MSTGIPLSVTRGTSTREKKNTAYVDVPKSPYPISTATSLATRKTRKENTAPSQSISISNTMPESTSLKRKHSISAAATGDQEPASTPSAKKQRINKDASRDAHTSGQTPIFQVSRLAIAPEALGLGINPSEEFPNGSVYCHQCCQRRDALDAAHCSSVTLKSYKSKEGPVEKPCKAKYCAKCLKKRYGEDITLPSKAGKDGKKVPFYFKCPRCRGVCNCSGCRKAKGLEPYGKFKNGQPVKQISDAPPPTTSKSTKSTKPKKAQPKGTGKPIVTVQLTHLKDLPPSTSSPLPPNSTHTSEFQLISVNPTTPAPRGRPKKPPKPVIPPLPQWKRIETGLGYEAALRRFEIREFVLRFSGLMEGAGTGMGVGVLSELDGGWVGDVSGSGSANGGKSGSEKSDEGQEEDGEEVTPWVSDACVKAMVLGLLGMLAKEEDLESVKHVQAAVKELRSVGTNNLNKVWSVLVTLRDTLGKPGQHDLDLDEDWLPDPSPPPKIASAYQTRATRSGQPSSSTVNVVHPTQFIPIVAALVEAAIRSDIVRDSFEADFLESKSITKHVREIIKLSDESWSTLRESLKAKGTKGKDGKEKDKNVIKEMRRGRERHKKFCEAAEMSGRIWGVIGKSVRWGPLGEDRDGNVYWSVTPGARERKAAGEWLGMFGEDGERKVVNGGGGASKKKVKPGSGGTEEERGGMGDWSWCVVVWRRGDEEDEEEGWWGFYQPAEIRKLADWVDWKAGCKIAEEQSTDLGNSLRGYAETLEWRSREDRYDEEAWGGEGGGSN